MGDPSSFWPTLSLVVGTAMWVLAMRFRRGDLVAPFSVALGPHRPSSLFDRCSCCRTSGTTCTDWDISSGFNQSARTGFLAILALSLGYLIAHLDEDLATACKGGRRSGLHRAAPLLDPPRGRRVSVPSVLWVVALAAKGGGLAFLPLLFAGRSARTEAALAGLPIVVGAFPVAAAVLIGTVRRLVERQRRLRVLERMCFWLVIAISVIPAVGQGQRRYLVPCLVAALIATTLPS